MTWVHKSENVGKGSERRKSLHRKSKKEHRKLLIDWSERRKYFFKLIRTSKDQNVENLKRIRTSKVKLDFRRSDFTYGVRKIRTSKIEKSNYLWRIAYVFQGLWGVRLGSVRLGKVWLGWVSLGKVRLCSVRLD